MWDKLPIEIQDNILHEASKQDRLEKSERNFNICEEIKTYHYMKSVWKIGHLQCGFSKCDSKYCKHRTFQQFNFRQTESFHFHLCVYGQCKRRNGQNERVYLGWELRNTDVAISIVKNRIFQ